MAGMAPQTLGQKRKAKVRTRPMWVPWDNEGKGGWRFVPSDTVHTGVVVVEGEGTPQSYYEAKGFIPEAFAPPEAKKLLEQIRAAGSDPS